MLYVRGSRYACVYVNHTNSLLEDEFVFKLHALAGKERRTPVNSIHCIPYHALDKRSGRYSNIIQAYCVAGPVVMTA